VRLLSPFLWLLPFLSFLFGYLIPTYYVTYQEIRLPVLVGKPVQEGMRLLTAAGINARMLREKIDPDLPSGIIVEQSPKGNQMIRPHQPVLITISQRPPIPPCPAIVGQKSVDISQLRPHRPERHFLQANYPAGVCFAQCPSPQQRMEGRRFIAYVSKGNEQLCVVPDYRGVALSEVARALHAHAIAYEVFGEQKVDAVVIDQTPRPGSIVDLSKKLHMQLQV